MHTIKQEEKEKQLLEKAARLAQDAREEEAFALYKEASERGNAEARIAVCRGYFYGKGTLLDRVTAFGWLAAAQEDPRAAYMLGWCTGAGLSRQDVRPEPGYWFLRAVQQDNEETADAMYRLALLCKAENRFEDARDWAVQAKLQGHATADNLLLRIDVAEDRYEHPENALDLYKLKHPEPGTPEAAELLLKEAEKGNTGYYEALGRYLEETEKNESRAMGYYFLAFEDAGSLFAADRLSHYYEAQGMFDEAVIWAQSGRDAVYSAERCAARVQEIRLHEKRRRIYEEAMRQESEDKKTSAHGLFMEAARLGSPDAIYFLIREAKKGHLTANDMRFVFRCAEDAARAGDRQFFTFVAQGYYKGTFTEKNAQLAEEWYRKSAEEAGNAEDMYRLSYLYYEQKRWKKAAGWAVRAMQNGVREAAEIVNACEKMLEQEEKNWQVQLETAEYGRPYAMCIVGYRLLYGLGVEKDEKRGLLWLEKAFDGGWEFAGELLKEYYEQKKAYNQ